MQIYRFFKIAADVIYGSLYAWLDTHEKYLVDSITVQNMVKIDAVVSIYAHLDIVWSMLEFAFANSNL